MIPENLTGIMIYFGVNMNKLMISEIQNRYDSFLNNTVNVNINRLLLNIRTEFRDYFGAVENHKLTYPFKLNGYKSGVIIFIQDHNKPKGRSLYVEMTGWNDVKTKIHMVPFIKFHNNPEGILILEKVLFRSV
jgi:hypothetical protein